MQVKYKRRLRFEAIQRFKRHLVDRRRYKAYNRLQTVKKMAISDRGIMAKELFEMEINDKKLNRRFFYNPQEPEIFVRKY